MVSSFRMGEPSPYMTNKGNWKTKFGSVLSILSLSVRAIIYPISPARRLYSVVGSDTLYFLGKSGITRKISLDYGHNQSPEQFKKSLSKPITFPYFHNFISLGKTVLDLIVIGQKQYMIQLDLTHRTATVCDTLVNDIDHTIPYIPREMVQNQGLMVLPALVFFHFIQPEQLAAIPALRNLTEDANPVIVVLNLKSSSL